MGFLDKLFGSKQEKPASRDLKEQALTAIDALNAQIVQLEENPDIPETEKAEQIRRLNEEIRTFSASMGWKYDA